MAQNKSFTTIDVGGTTYDIIETPKDQSYRCGECDARFDDNLCFALPLCDRKSRTDDKNVIYRVKLTTDSVVF